jgi:hypothetical protein
MDSAVGAAIGVAGTLVGTGLGFTGAFFIARCERRHALRRERRQAFATYLAALYPAVAELRELPPVRKAAPGATLLDRVRGEEATFVATRRRERAVFGDRPRELADRVAIALASLQVMALPADVRTACEAAAEYIERLAAQRSPEINAEWSTIYEQLHAAARLLSSDKKPS